MNDWAIAAKELATAARAAEKAARAILRAASEEGLGQNHVDYITNRPSRNLFSGADFAKKVAELSQTLSAHSHRAAGQ